MCAAVSLVLSVAASVDPGRALLELAMVAAGALAGAWALPAVARLLSRLRGTSGQSSAEYMGALLLVAVIIGALLAAGIPAQIADRMSGNIDAIAGGNGPRTTSYGDDQREPVVDPTADDDGDGLTNEEEEALGTDPNEADSDGDGMSDTEEFEHGTDPNQGIDALTEENAFKPWERLGISEDDWNDLVESILDEINPGGWKSFLFGDAAESIVLDENGELVLVPPGAMVGYEDGKLKIYPLMENGVGGGLVKGLAKILGAGGKSASTALKNALAKLSPSLRAELASSGLLKGVEGAAETAKALPRFQPGRWFPHFEKHAAEFGYRTPVEYLKGARDLTARSGTRAFTRSNGDKLIYDSATNEFAVLKPDGDPADILQAQGRLRLLAEGSSPRDDRKPRPRSRAARRARPAARRGHARRAAPRLEPLRDGGRARLRRHDLRLHERAVRPDSPRPRDRGREPRAARAARARGRRGRPPLHGRDGGGRAPARHVPVGAARAASPRRRAGRRRQPAGLGGRGRAPLR